MVERYAREINDCKGRGETVVEWIWKECMGAWNSGQVSDDWLKVIIVPLYQERRSKSYCKDYRLIRLLSLFGKIYGMTVTDHFKRISEPFLVKNKAVFRKGRECVDLF